MKLREAGEWEGETLSCCCEALDLRLVEAGGESFHGGRVEEWVVIFQIFVK